MGLISVKLIDITFGAGREMLWLSRHSSNSWAFPTHAPRTFPVRNPHYQQSNNSRTWTREKDCSDRVKQFALLGRRLQDWETAHQEGIDYKHALDSGDGDDYGRLSESVDAPPSRFQ